MNKAIIILPLVFIVIVFFIVSSRRDKKKRVSLLKKIAANLGFDCENVDHNSLRQFFENQYDYLDIEFIAQKNINDLNIFIYESCPLGEPAQTVVLFHHNKINFSPSSLCLEKITDNCFFTAKKGLFTKDGFCSFFNDAFRRYNIQSGRTTFYNKTTNKSISSVSLLAIPDNEVYSSENLLACLNSITDRERALAVYYLSEFPNKEATPILLKMLNNPHDNLKIDILNALGATREKLLSVHIIPYLSHAKNELSKAAADALETLEWTPENNTEQVNYLIAQNDWTQILSLGASIIPDIYQILSIQNHIELKSYLEKIIHQVDRIIFG